MSLKSKLVIRGRLKKQKTKASDGNLYTMIDQMFDIPYFSGRRERLLKLIQVQLGSKKHKGLWLVTINPEFVMKACEDRQFLDLLRNKSSLNVIDGIGLLWAEAVKKRLMRYELRFGSKVIRKIIKLGLGFEVGFGILLGKYRKKLIAGSDLINDVCRMASEKHLGVYFLGGFNQAAEKTAEFFKDKYKGLEVIGCYEGMAVGDDAKTVEEIKKDIMIHKKDRIDILFVAYGMKSQEEWIDRNRDKLNPGLVMGVGRSFDYYSGQLARAPMTWRKMGLEWLYSLLVDPKRWRRQLALPRFIWKVMSE